MTYLRAVFDEAIEPITLLGFFSLGVWKYADEFAKWLDYFDSHQVALTGFVLFVFSVIKKYYQLRSERAKYLKSKREAEGKE